MAVVKRKVDSVLFAVLDLVFSGLHGPDVGHSPGSDDLQVRGQRFDAQLETDLVVPFSGSAVTDGGSAFLAGDLHQLFGDCRTCHGSSQQVFVFIYCVCLYAGHDIILGKIVGDVFDV